MCLRVAVQVCLHVWPGERVGDLEFVCVGVGALGSANAGRHGCALPGAGVGGLLVLQGRWLWLDCVARSCL